MNIREVERTIRGLVGGPFTGKAVVRIVDGKIIACDVGAFGTGMPWLTPGELMKRCVNVPEPLVPPDDVREAEEAREHARQNHDKAKEAFFRAQDKLRELERQVAAHSERSGVVPVDAFGAPVSEEVTKARATVDLLRDGLAIAAAELQQATAHCSDLTRSWRQGLRLAELETEKQRNADLAAAEETRHRGRIGAALKNFAGI